MPRTARQLHDGGFFHLVNRGNDRKTVFHTPADYAVFVGLMTAAKLRFPLFLFGYCLMPNHFHLLVKAELSEDVRAFIHWIMTCYTRHFHERQGTSGHIWQGRFSSFVIDCEEYLITALRYIESNPLRAGLVRSNKEWDWSSLKSHLSKDYGRLVDAPPFYLAEGWLELVDMPLTEKEYESLRKNKRDSPSAGTVPGSR
jgi:putative transposase